MVGHVDEWGLGVREEIIPLLPEVNGVDLILTTTEDFLNVTTLKRLAGDG